MDERTRSATAARRLALVAALCVGPAAAFAGERGESSGLRAQLAAGFGAGTNSSLIRQVPSKPVVVRPAARVHGIPAPTVPKIPLSGEERNSTSAVPVVVEEANKVVSEMLPKLPPLKRSLAELLRSAESANTGQPAMKDGSPTVEARIESEQESIQVEYAPRVRRIQLGTYDPNRDSAIDPDAVVQFAVPVDAKLLVKPQPDLIQVPDEPDYQPSIGTTPQSPENLPEKLPEVVNPTRMPQPPTESVQKSASAPSTVSAPLMRALADPELSELIEATPVESTHDIRGELSEDLTEGAGFSSGRSRRLAGVSGFELLPLDRIGSE